MVAGQIQKHTPEVSKILRVGNAHAQIKAPYGVAGQIGDLGLHQHFVGVPHHQIVTRADPGGKQSDRQNFPRYAICADLHPVAEDKWFFKNNEQSTNDVGHRSLRGKTQGNSQNPGSPKKNLQVKTELAQGTQSDDACHHIGRDLPTHGGLLRFQRSPEQHVQGSRCQAYQQHPTEDYDRCLNDINESCCGKKFFEGRRIKIHRDDSRLERKLLKALTTV